MTEPTLSGGGPDSASAPICPWCSATLVTGQEESCPSCGAALREAAESEVPGVTRVDVEAILKARTPAPRGRGLMGWLSGDDDAEGPTASHEGIAPPDQAVRREMLRLELAALEAEAQARQAEVAAELAEAHGAAAGHADDRAEGAGDPGAGSDGDRPGSGDAAGAPPPDAPAADASAADAPASRRRSKKAKPG
jgi:hypothetical protein